LPRRIPGNEGMNNMLAKKGLFIDQIEGDIEDLAYPACIFHPLRRAAAVVVRPAGAGFGPKAHHQANHLVTGLDQQPGGDTAIHAPTQSDDHPAGRRGEKGGQKVRRGCHFVLYVSVGSPGYTPRAEWRA